MSAAPDIPSDGLSGKLVRFYWPMMGLIMLAAVLLGLGKLIYRPFDQSLPPPDQYAYVNAAFGLTALLFIPVLAAVVKSRWMQAHTRVQAFTVLAVVFIPTLIKMFDREGPWPMLQMYGIFFAINGGVWVLSPILRPVVGWLAGSQPKYDRVRPLDLGRD